MAASPELIWLLVKNSNRFLVKRNGNGTASLQFSSEPSNLYNKNTYKFSGLADPKTVGITADDDGHVTLATSKAKKSTSPASALHKDTLKKDFRRQAKAVATVVGSGKYRPDLKKAALARLAAVHKSLRVAKAGTKKPKSSNKLSVRK